MTFLPPKSLLKNTICPIARLIITTIFRIPYTLIEFSL